ncbi:uncharacterized protein SCDLUD_005229 [Saccharomycodes ludwigii]|uniref:uncharacterized protein n=1 Tax=Saccharomycodes ludwigii TaxID=36035 RepID=UPI001E888BF3|nr:hypothetical protein SCDLUD_005229 [Saccharomycodes ludwigii]KAH3898888.1 hypothetical protein SCDLUD_005229 [Saccharomycodes ludwigii]
MGNNLIRGMFPDCLILILIFFFFFFFFWNNFIVLLHKQKQNGVFIRKAVLRTLGQTAFLKIKKKKLSKQIHVSFFFLFLFSFFFFLFSFFFFLFSFSFFLFLTDEKKNKNFLYMFNLFYKSNQSFQLLLKKFYHQFISTFFATLLHFHFHTNHQLVLHISKVQKLIQSFLL